MDIRNSTFGEKERWPTQRRYVRIPIATPVELYTKGSVGPPLIGQISNLSVGGVLASCRKGLDVQTELAMLFELPTGVRIHAFGRVIYALQVGCFGTAFLDLDRDARLHLEEFIQKMLGHARRTVRVPYRTHFIITTTDAAEARSEQLAATVLASRNGGLLVCRTPYSSGQEIYLWSPEWSRGIRARVVFQQTWAPAGLVEVGFEFLTDEDFWQIDFETEHR